MGYKLKINEINFLDKSIGKDYLLLFLWNLDVDREEMFLILFK